MNSENFSIDSIWDSSLRIQQSRQGYRFALDAILLAHFLRMNHQEDVLEIGCGNGIIPVLLSKLKQYRKIIAVEIQTELAQLARINVRENLAQRIGIIEFDALQLRDKFSAGSFDLLYSNPPYRKLGTGRLNPSTEKAIARHEIHLKVQDLMNLADYFLNSEGRISLILPQFRENDWELLVSERKYYFLERQYVHSFRNDSPAFVLTTASRKFSQLHEFPPLIIYEKPGEYTQEMKALLTRR